MTMKRVYAALATLFALTFNAVPQEQKISPAVASLVAAERAFARTSVEKGIRESFLEFFADDGINFQPHPTKTRAAYLSRPAPATRPPVTLDWGPVWADVAQSGELGYTTGPFTLTDHSPDKRPTLHGYYFSVWKKQADGNWKVVLDQGTLNSAPSAAPPAFHAPSAVSAKKQSAMLSAEGGRAELLEVERGLLREAQARGYLKALAEYLTSESRLHRQEMLPLVGKERIKAFLKQKTAAVTWEPLQADIAQAGDLGYVYGSYELRDNPAQVAAIEKGYFTRVWKRDREGRWKVALDVTTPLPPEQK